MMNSITEIGFIAQLAGISRRVVANMYLYFEAVKDAPKHSRELRQEMGTICDLFDSLEDLITKKSQFSPSASLRESLSEFQLMLNEMNERVKVSQTVGLKRLKWPFTKDKNEELLSRISSYKKTFELALSMQSASDIKKILDHVQVERRNKILEWLSGGSFFSRHEQLQKTRTKHSGQWFVESKEFNEWIDGTGPQCLLCSGIPGAGKSILISIAIDSLLNRFENENVAVVFAYFDYKAQQSQTAIDIAAILLKQLLSQFDEIPPQLEALYDRCTRSNSRPEQATLIKLLTSCSKKFTSLYGVFDALDECNESHQTDIVTLFASLRNYGYRLCISFRPHSKRLLDALHNSKTIEITANESDLTNYAMTRLHEKRNQSVELKDRCLQLTKEVDGMFLLAKFQLDHILNPKEPRERLKAIKTIPKDMFSAYHDVMERIEQSDDGDTKLALKVLSWVYRAHRILSIRELCECLVVEVGDKDLKYELMPNSSDVIDCCKSLVVCDESTDLVRFSHYTVREFISCNIEQKLPPTINLAKTCVTYLAFAEFDKPRGRYFDHVFKNRVARYKLSGYVAKYWASHVRGEAEGEDDVQRLVFQAFESITKTDARLEFEADLSDVSGYRKRSGNTLLHILADKGLATLLKVFVDGTARSKNTGEALCSKLRNISSGFSAQNEEGWTPLHRAAEKGHTKVVKLLLAVNANVEARNCRGHTPLWLATCGGHSKVVKLLLVAKANVDEKMVYGETALSCAAQFGFIEVAKLLLEAKANINETDYNGRGALHYAAGTGHVEMVRLLLEAHADVTLRDEYDRTALHFAALLGKVDVMGVLLEAIRRAQETENVSQLSLPFELAEIKNIHSITVLQSLNWLYPSDQILQRALGEAYFHAKMYLQARDAFDLSVRVGMESAGAVHIDDIGIHGVNCRECHQQLRGIQYKCTSCHWDYDICQRCFEKLTHRHPLEDIIRIPSDDFFAKWELEV